MTEYFSEIWRLRYFWYSLVRTDLRKRYRRSVLGMGWSLLQPIAMTIVLSVVFSQMWRQNLRDFAPYLLCGLTFWGFISAAVMQGCQCFLEGESYIRQHPAPLAIYPLRTVLGAGFHFLLGFSINLIFVWILKGFGNLPALVSLVPTFLLVFILVWSLAICMGLVTVMFQDAQHLVEILMQVLFYATPIIIPPEAWEGRRLVSCVMHLNPLAAFLELIRDPLLKGQIPSLHAYGFAALTTLAIAGIAMLGMKRFEKNLIFYL